MEYVWRQNLEKGSAMAAISIVALLLVVVIVLGVGGLFAARKAGSAAQPSQASANQDQIRFPVPTGLDAAVVVTTLQREGFQADTEIDERNQSVIVITGDSLDREKIRAALRDVPYREGEQPAEIDEVRFADE